MKNDGGTRGRLTNAIFSRSRIRAHGGSIRGPNAGPASTGASGSPVISSEVEESRGATFKDPERNPSALPGMTCCWLELSRRRGHRLYADAREIFFDSEDVVRPLHDLKEIVHRRNLLQLLG
jgi:hypothetical protein